MRGQAGDHPVPAVRRPDRHPVAGVHTEADHRCRGAAHLVPQLGEGERPIFGDQGIVVGKFARDVVQRRRNGLRVARHRTPRLFCYRRWRAHFAAGLTKQVLGRLAYRGARRRGVQGRGPRLAGREPGRRIRRPQGARRPRSRARGVRRAARLEPASRKGRSDVSGVAGRTRRPRSVRRTPGGVLRGIRDRQRARPRSTISARSCSGRR